MYCLRGNWYLKNLTQKQNIKTNYIKLDPCLMVKEFAYI